MTPTYKQLAIVCLSYIKASQKAASACADKNNPDATKLVMKADVLRERALKMARKMKVKV